MERGYFLLRFYSFLTNLSGYFLTELIHKPKCNSEKTQIKFLNPGRLSNVKRWAAARWVCLDSLSGNFKNSGKARNSLTDSGTLMKQIVAAVEDKKCRSQNRSTVLNYLKISKEFESWALLHRFHWLQKPNIISRQANSRPASARVPFKFTYSRLCHTQP